MYIPWRGVFHQMQKVDLFVHYDDVQYERGGWQNRNRVKRPGGVGWLTIPVTRKGHLERSLAIGDVRISAHEDWASKHWNVLRESYAEAPYWETYSDLLRAHYASPPQRLVDFTIPLLEAVAHELGIKTRFLRASELGVSGAKTDRLLAVLEAVGARHYLSGPAAKAYLDEPLLADRGISVEYMTYDYPAYPQLHGEYDPAVSIVDLLFMTGPAAGAHIWGDLATTPG